MIILVTVLPIRIAALGLLWFISWIGELADVAADWVSYKIPGLEFVRETEAGREERMRRIAGLRKTSQERIDAEIDMMHR
jgi:hypothetical protein